MEFFNGNNKLILSDTGSVVSYKIDNTEFIAEGREHRDLLMLKLLDDDGEGVYYPSSASREIELEKADNGICITYKGIGDKIDAHVTILPNDNKGFKWTVSVDNNSGMSLEWIDFPKITVVDSLKGENGDFDLFWPSLEGQIIENKTLRDKLWIKYREIGGQTGGYCGFYPGSCPMHFMAYYNDNCGMYFGAHDKKHNPKTVEYYGNDDGLVLEYRLFCNGSVGHFEMGYDMITSSFKGDWHDAADIYRSWMKENTELPEKLCENKELPSWLEDSPIVVLYPIRGTMDRGDMTPNLYYPYKNILPYVDYFAKETGSKIMALPMHWEGTAPWATPYVWPPFGGEEEFTEFINALHEKGNLAGVYCSGIGWTTKSFLNPELDFSDRYDETLICRTPKGTIEQSNVIGEPIRLGNDMCPYSEKVGDIVVGEVTSIAESGCDYAQYFDQNLGGESSFCYAKDHGHPITPGIWQNEAMIRIFKRVRAALRDMGSNMIIGCESAASEAFLKYLPFNDLRYNVGFFLGKPVPAYAYLFHEYINNFMGNQNTIHSSLDLSKNPDCVLFRIAYSFVAGDMLTYALGDNGTVHWGWDVKWDEPSPLEQPILELSKNLNGLRREYKEYLHTGKMIKPVPLLNVGEFTLYLKSGYETKYPSLLTSRWENNKGEQKQVIVNFLNHKQTCSVDNNKLTIPPLSALWID